MSEFVCPNTLRTFGPMLRTINEGGGGKYTLLERSLHWESKNVNSRTIGATRQKLLWQKSKI